MRLAFVALAVLLASGTAISAGALAAAEPPDPAASPIVAPDTTALTGADGLAVEPAGLAVDAFGHRWVSDAARHRLLRFDAAGRFLEENGALGSAPAQFRRPGAVAPFGATAIAVLDRENRRIVGHDTRGRAPGVLVDLAATALEQQVGRVDAVGLACDAGGALYVADADRDRVLVFDFAGAWLRTIGGFGGGGGSFRHLVAITAAGRGELVTLEWLAGGKVKGRGDAPDSTRAAALRLQRLDASGNAVEMRTWDAPASAEWSLAVDPVGGRVAVAGAGRLWCFALGDAPGAPLACARPAVVAFAPDGALLVAEPGRLVRHAATRE